MSSKIRVGVVRGGPSSEYEVSLKSGNTALKHIPDHYHVKDILISKDGEWHIDGVARSPDKALSHIDVVFNAMHGEFGEDGKVQKILESLQKPYTGSDSFSSAIGMNKILSKNLYRTHGIKTPHDVIVKIDDDLEEVQKHLFKHFLLPAVVKPAATGSSVGISLVRHYEDIPAALAEAFKYSDTVLLEEYIAGREATCGVVDNFRDEGVYALLPGEIIKPAHKDLFDYEAKYSGISEEIFPGNFTEEEKKEMQAMAIAAHKALRLRHYSRSDFMVHPRRGIYMLETNTLPGLTSESLFPKSLEAIGCSLSHFFDHLIKLALARK